MPHHCRAHQSWCKGKQRRARLSDRTDQSKIDPSRERCPQSLQPATPTVQGQSLWSKCIDGPGSIGLIANCIKSSRRPRSSLDDEGIKKSNQDEGFGCVLQLPLDFPPAAEFPQRCWVRPLLNLLCEHVAGPSIPCLMMKDVIINH